MHTGLCTPCRAYHNLMNKQQATYAAYALYALYACNTGIPGLRAAALGGSRYDR